MPKTTPTTNSRRHSRPKHRTQPRPTTQTPDLAEKEEREEMVFGFEERREKRAEKEEREKNRSTELVERNFVGGIKYIYIFFRILLQYNSNFGIVL